MAWLNGKSGRQSWRFPALYNIGNHLPFLRFRASCRSGRWPLAVHPFVYSHHIVYCSGVCHLPVDSDTEEHVCWTVPMAARAAADASPCCRRLRRPPPPPPSAVAVPSTRSVCVDDEASWLPETHRQHRMSVVLRHITRPHDHDNRLPPALPSSCQWRHF